MSKVYLGAIASSFLLFTVLFAFALSSVDPRIKQIKAQEKEAREAKKAAASKPGTPVPGKGTATPPVNKKEEEEKEAAAKAEAKKAKAAAANAAKKARRAARATDGDAA